MVEFNETITVLILNEEEATRRIPVMVYLGILLVLGVLGNSTVMILYSCYFSSSNRRTFVLCLATLDLTASCLCIPFEIADMRLPYMFYQTPVCKFFRFFQPFTSVGSALVLLVIAIERYLKVCRPLRKQMSHFQAKVLCGTAVGLAVLCSWPTSVFHGQKQIYLKHNITGIDCSRDDYYRKSIYKLIYDVSLAVMFVVGISVLITLYFLMGRTIYRHEKFRRSNAYYGSNDYYKSQTPNRKSTDINYPLREEYSDNTISESVPMDVKDERENVHLKIIINNKADEKPSVKICDSDASDTRCDKKCICDKRKIKSQHSHRDKRSWKITKTMFIITLVYILSFLPHLALLLIKLLKPDITSQPGILSSAVFPIVSRSIFINNVANPIIYGFWDAAFRQKCLQCCLRKKHCVPR